MKKILFFLPLLILFFSCSQNLPELESVSASSIYEYKTPENLPEIRLGVYLDVTSDVHRAERIRFICRSNNFEWECLDPVKLESGRNGSKKYAGYSNFVMPGNEAFPEGQYVVFYTDLNGNEKSTSFNLPYVEKLATMVSEEAAVYLKEKSAVEFIAVYDENLILLFYGIKEDEKLDESNVWSRFPDAAFYRTVWTMNNGRVVCIMPPVNK